MLLGGVIALVLMVGFAVLGAGLTAADKAISKGADDDKRRTVAVTNTHEQTEVG